MSEWTKHYIGRDVTASEDNGVMRPVSRVTLNVDPQHVYTAGDDTGYEVIADCPHATQAMVDALLAKLKGYQYQMLSGDAAGIDPAAELGDGITVDGKYSVLSHISDDGSGYMDVSAPGEAELEDEYPTDGPLTRKIARQIAETRSSITKTSEEILLQVERTYATQTALSSVSVTADKINWLVKSGTSSSDFQMTDRAIKLVADTIDLTGFVTFHSLETAGETTINGSNITTGELLANLIKSGRIESKNGSVYFDLDNNEIACSQLRSSNQIDKGTLIDENQIFVDISYKSTNRGEYYSNVQIYRNYYKDDGINIDPYPLSVPGQNNLSQGMIYSQKPISIVHSATGALGSGTAKLELDNESHSVSLCEARLPPDGSSQNYYLYGFRSYDNAIDIIAYPQNIPIINISAQGGQIAIRGDLVSRGGTKNRAVDTANYDTRLHYCYEMASPLFGDAGEGETDADGECYVYLDDIFAETVSSRMEYQVFLQREGPGDIWVAEKTQRYFLVKGTGNLRFAWEVKAHQYDYEYERLERDDTREIARVDGDDVCYASIYEKEIQEIIKETEEALYEAA